MHLLVVFKYDREWDISNPYLAQAAFEQRFSAASQAPVIVIKKLSRMKQAL